MSENIANLNFADAGPLLTRLFASHEVEARATAFPAIIDLADQVIEQLRALPDSVLLPLGDAAQRVAGVVAARSEGGVAVDSSRRGISAETVVLLEIAAVSSVDLQTTAAQLKRRGALHVHGLGVAVDGAHDAAELDSYVELGIDTRDFAGLVSVGFDAPAA